MFKRIMQLVVLAMTLVTIGGASSPDTPEPVCFPCSR
jgi:hypothetical protein